MGYTAGKRHHTKKRYIPLPRSTLASIVTLTAVPLQPGTSRSRGRPKTTTNHYQRRAPPTPAQKATTKLPDHHPLHHAAGRGVLKLRGIYDFRSAYVSGETKIGFS